MPRRSSSQRRIYKHQLFNRKERKVLRKGRKELRTISFDIVIEIDIVIVIVIEIVIDIDIVFVIVIEIEFVIEFALFTSVSSVVFLAIKKPRSKRGFL